MNTAQTVFTVFYGLYFAAIVTITGPFRGFDTPAMYGGKRRAWLRFAFSFALLNLVLLAYFVIVFDWLGPFLKFQVTYWSMVVLLILSLAGFGFYRIYFGVMLLRAGGKYVFYGPKLPLKLIEELLQRSERQTRFCLTSFLVCSGCSLHWRLDGGGQVFGGDRLTRRLSRLRDSVIDLSISGNGSAASR